MNGLSSKGKWSANQKRLQHNLIDKISLFNFPK